MRERVDNTGPAEGALVLKTEGIVERTVHLVPAAATGRGLQQLSPLPVTGLLPEKPVNQILVIDITLFTVK